MNTKTLPLLFVALGAADSWAGGPTAFPANRLYVLGATDGAELITEVDYTTVANASVNASTTIRTIGDTNTLSLPSGCAFGPDGNLYVVTSDPANASAPFAGQILVYGPDGIQIGPAIVPPNLSNARGIAFGPDGHIFVCSSGNGVVMELDADGTHLQNIGLGAGMVEPTGVVVGPNGNLFISDPSSNTIYEFAPVQSTNPVRTLTVGGNLNEPYGMTVGPRGHLFVVNRGTNTVLEIDENGALVQTIGLTSTLQAPEYIAIGFDGHLYVSSRSSGRVVVFDGDETPVGAPHQQIAVIGGTASVTIDNPTGIAFAPQRFGVDITGNVYEVGAAKAKLSETFKNSGGPIVTWAPGSRFLMLSVVDNVANDNDIASIFGGDELAFAGFQTTLDIENAKRAYAGQMIPAPNLDAGSTTIFLDVTGKVNAEDQFLMKEFTGRIIIQSRNAIYQGKLTSVKEIK